MLRRRRGLLRLRLRQGQPLLLLLGPLLLGVRRSRGAGLASPAPAAAVVLGHGPRLLHLCAGLQANVEGI